MKVLSNLFFIKLTSIISNSDGKEATSNQYIHAPTYESPSEGAHFM